MPPTAGIWIARDRLEDLVMGTDGVNGIEVGQSPIGEPMLVVRLLHAAGGRSVPERFEGFPVRKEVTGPIDALPA
jgi:hypothetical protein